MRAWLPETLDLLTGVTVKRSFDRISVDGQLSTSDTVFALANGASGVEIEPETADELALGEAMDALLRQLAVEIVADGEGAERVGRVVVNGRPDASSGWRGRWPTRRSSRPRSTEATPTSGACSRRRARSGRQASSSSPTSRSRAASSSRPATRSSSPPRTCGTRAGGSGETRSSTASRIPGDGGETEVFFSDLSEEYVTFNSAYTS